MVQFQLDPPFLNWFWAVSSIGQSSGLIIHWLQVQLLCRPPKCGCSSVGRARGCGPRRRRFETDRSPHLFNARVAQLDRAATSYVAGCRFNSCRALHSPNTSFLRLYPSLLRTGLKGNWTHARSTRARRTTSLQPYCLCVRSSVDRAPASEAGGRRFESGRAHQWRGRCHTHTY